MALEHALLVSLRERPGTGIELTRRFDRSIGFFWRATHQQIYRVLRRMEADGWVAASAGDSRRTERRYEVTEELIRAAAARVVELGWCKPGDRVGITAGLPSGKPGTTSLLQVQEV